MEALEKKIQDILVVEDSKEMQDLYRFIFTEYAHKYTVDIYGTPPEALATLKEKRFDLIILDMIMQPLTGDSLFVTLRKEYLLSTPILIVSVLSPELLRNLRNIGPVEFLQKPIIEEEFIEKIEQMLL